MDKKTLSMAPLECAAQNGEVIEQTASHGKNKTGPGILANRIINPARWQ
jgi:hypothetical protein